MSIRVAVKSQGRGRSAGDAVSSGRPLLPHRGHRRPRPLRGPRRRPHPPPGGGRPRPGRPRHPGPRRPTRRRRPLQRLPPPGRHALPGGVEPLKRGLSARRTYDWQDPPPWHRAHRRGRSRPSGEGRHAPGLRVGCRMTRSGGKPSGDREFESPAERTSSPGLSSTIQRRGRRCTGTDARVGWAAGSRGAFRRLWRDPSGLGRTGSWPVASTPLLSSPARPSSRGRSSRRSPCRRSSRYSGIPRRTCWD